MQFIKPQACQRFSGRTAFQKFVRNKSTSCSTSVAYHDLHYTKLPLNRSPELRNQPQVLKQLSDREDARLVPVWKQQNLVKKTENDEETQKQSDVQYSAVFVTPARDWKILTDNDVSLVFLGIDSEQQPYFAAKVREEEGDQLSVAFGCEWQNLRKAGQLMESGNATILALARGLVVFHENNAFDAKSGRPSFPTSAGHSRTSDTQTSSVYPRLDPAVLALVMWGDYCLLGSSQKWPQGRYSLLAGFCEMGESLEQTVQREVLEESGVVVNAEGMVYKGSQPWPFPHSLMLGFVAAAATNTQNQIQKSGYDLVQGEARNAALDSGITEIELTAYLKPLPPDTQPDLQELKDARWFHKDWISAQINNRTHLLPFPQLSNFTTPGRYALARRILHEVTDSGLQWKGDDIPDVDIDIGRFKYVLIRVSDEVSGQSKLVVKGSTKATYHIQAFQSVKAICVALGLKAQVLGGGRIEHYPEQQVISIYGYSSAFGFAVHEVTASIIQRWFPFYKFDQITTSYEGY